MQFSQEHLCKWNAISRAIVDSSEGKQSWSVLYCTYLMWSPVKFSYIASCSSHRENDWIDTFVVKSHSLKPKVKLFIGFWFSSGSEFGLALSSQTESHECFVQKKYSHMINACSIDVRLWHLRDYIFLHFFLRQKTFYSHRFANLTSHESVKVIRSIYCI